MFFYGLVAIARSIALQKIFLRTGGDRQEYGFAKYFYFNILIFFI